MSEGAERQEAASAFERIGGRETVDRLVEAFYRNMQTLPEARGILAMHAADLRPITLILQNYLGEWLGGPPDYSTRRGHPRLRMRHMPFAIGVAERDAWMACMRAALTETVADAALRDGIEMALARLADHMRNQPES